MPGEDGEERNAGTPSAFTAGGDTQRLGRWIAVGVVVAVALVILLFIFAAL